MKHVLVRVADRFESLKKEYGFPIYLKRINGRFYVYRAMIVADQGGARKTATVYLGRINDDGSFLKKEASRMDSLENAIRVVEANGGRVIFAQGAEQEEGMAHPTAPVEEDKQLLSVLSMNAKASYRRIGKTAGGLPPTTVYNRVRAMEKRYGIEYLPEVDLQQLGYLSYITFVKFLDDGIPDIEEMKATLEAEPNIQIAMLTRGEYDLVLYIFAKDNREISLLLIKLQNQTFFSRYKSKWYTTLELDAYGFIPLRDRFFELLKEDAAGKDREPGTGRRISYREFIVLRELNADGAVEFSEIEKRNGLDRGAAQYAYYSMKRRGMVKRITASATKLPIMYNGIIMTTVVNGSDSERTRPWFLSEIISEGSSIVNKYAFSGTVETPKGGILIMPVFKEGEFEATLEGMLKNMDGVEVKTMLISSMLVGKLCYRHFDNDYSRQAELLVNQYKSLKPHVLIGYED